MDILKRNKNILLLIVTILVTLSIYSVSQAQLSPGDLALPHEHLEGISNCTNCHELGEGPSAEKCLDCHVLIKDRIKQKKGYHYKVTSTDNKPCFECHSDHAGRDFNLVHWPDGIAKFDHTITGFNLIGKHTSLPCRDCHNPSLIKEDLLAIEKSKDLTRTYLGLGVDCLSCHLDEHRGQLGNDCLKCHNNEKFKPPIAFSHNETGFALIGKHQTVNCDKCHPRVKDDPPIPSARNTFVKYKPIRSNNCTSCHKDTHQSKFGLDCTKCHSTSGWKNISSADFDHRNTGFPLIGMHVKLPCAKCHTGGNMTSKLKHDQCMDCHKDIHQSQFAQREDKGACDACHNEHGFMPALFAMQEHNKTDFQLTGAHLAQPCIACHKMTTTSDGTTFRQFQVKHESCLSCHRDIHAGQFSIGEPVKFCTTCHNDLNWHDLKFNHDSDTRYKLVGAHKKVNCEGCHKPEQIAEEKTIRYRPIAHRCQDCHKVGTVSKGLN